MSDRSSLPAWVCVTILRLSLLDIFFFFLMILMREGDRYTKKVHPLKAISWPLHREKKNKRGFMGWVGVEGVCGCGS